MNKKFIFLNILYSLLVAVVILVTAYVWVWILMVPFDETPMEQTIGTIYTVILIGTFPATFVLVWFFRSKFAKAMPQNILQ